jgi:hypothetical protein
MTPRVGFTKGKALQRKHDQSSTDPASGLQPASLAMTESSDAMRARVACPAAGASRRERWTVAFWPKDSLEGRFMFGSACRTSPCQL